VGGNCNRRDCRFWTTRGSNTDLRTVLNAGVAEAVPNLACLDKQVSVRNRCKAQSDKRRLIRVALGMAGDDVEKGRFCRGNAVNADITGTPSGHYPTGTLEKQFFGLS
jgi:hypothetical protein